MQFSIVKVVSAVSEPMALLSTIFPVPDCKVKFCAPLTVPESVNVAPVPVEREVAPAKKRLFVKLKGCATVKRVPLRLTSPPPL